MTTPNKIRGRALLLAGIMVVSMVAMSAAFAGSAVAESDAERTIETTTASPGETVEVTVTFTIDDGDSNTGIDETFVPEFADVSVNPIFTNGEFFGDAITVSDNDFASFNFESEDIETGDTVEINYEVTIPEDADPDDEFEFIGTTEDSTEITGDNTITVTEPEPGPFTVSNLEPVTENVDPGEELTVSADVTNTGDGAGASDVRLLVDGDEIETKSVDLEPGEAESVPFTTTAPAEPGIYTHTIETDDGQLSGTLTVGDVEFSVSDLDPETATRAQGDPVDVSATITNTGDIGTEQDVRLVIDAETVDTQPIELGAGDTTSVPFDSVDTAELQPGEYQHGIATDQDSVQGALTIEHSVVTYQDETGTVQTEGLRDAILDWRDGDFDTELLRDIIEEWRQA